MVEVPVLEVDGKRTSQSGAILTWLADTTGHFAPAAEQRYEALRWILFDNHKFTNNHAIHRFQKSFMPEPAHPAVLAFMRARAESSFAIVEKHPADRPFMLGERPSLVDFSLAGYIYYPPDETGFDISADYPAIDAWRNRLVFLMRQKTAYEMMPVGSDLRVGRAYR